MGVTRRCGQAARFVGGIVGASAVGAASPLSSAAGFAERVGRVGHAVPVSVGGDGGGGAFPAKP
jgi:hypothetical protein